MSTYKFKTTNIRGKQYVEVTERVKFFRQEEQYKGWSIQTFIDRYEGDEVIMKARVLNSDGRAIAEGHAHEVKGSSNINKTSFIENCETSAVGRALAMLGIGIDTSIASANEVESAIQQDPEPAPKKRTTKKAPAKKAEPKKEEAAPVEDIMDKAINYIKSSPNKRKAYDLVIGKYEDQLSEQQQAGLLKFVR